MVEAEEAAKKKNAGRVGCGYKAESKYQLKKRSRGGAGQVLEVNAEHEKNQPGKRA